MRAAVESYQSPTHSSQSNMMRDYNVIMNGLEYVDEDALISQLMEDNFSNRMAALEQLRNELRTNGRLRVRNVIGLFQGIDCTLTDCNKDVRRQCLFFIIESMPCLNRDIDACLNIVIPRIVSNIGDPRIVVRKVAFQTVRAYMKHTSDMPSLLRNYIQYGIEHTDPKVRKESTVLLPVMITEDFAREDFSELVTSLCKKLVDNNEEETLQQAALTTLTKLCSQIGETRFRSYLLKLKPQLRDCYCRLAHFHMEVQDTSPTSHYLAEPAPQVTNQSQELYYGVIPAAMRAQLSDDNFRNRSQAVEQLKTLMEGLPSISPLLPYVKEFLSMLNGLLDDNNFKIITVTLDIMAILVEKMSRDMQPHLEVLIQALTKRMGDNKNVIRQAITKVILQLMQTLRPKIVLLLLCNNLSHRSPRVRAEAINCVINALLTFPSYEFDLPALCSSMSYCLLDMKRVVRHAALECIAVLAQCLGAGKIHPLLATIDSLEKKYGAESEGLTTAVQARLSRRLLPRRNEDSLIEYAVQLPSLNSSRNGSLGAQGADVDWILAVSGGGGNSARSMRVEDLESTSRQSSASIDGRRHLSSGKKSKLPWEDSQAPKGGESPIKPKATWTDEKTPDIARKPSKHGKQRDDLLLGITPASMSYSGSPEASNVESPDVDVSTKPPFSKSSKSKQEGATPRISKQAQKETAEIGVAANKSFGGKPMLNPLPVRDGSPNALLANTWAYETLSSSTKDLSSSNIPVKASTIPRKNNTNKPAKVPPIPKSHSPVNPDDDNIPVDNNGNELPQLNASLSKIRSSASKKKADKIFERLEKQQSEIEVITSPSTASSSSESKADNPFEARPKLARYSSQSKSKSSTESGEKIPGVQAVSQSKLNEGRPTKSESLILKIRQSTSKNLVSSQGADEEMVAVVGRGYSDDTLTTPPKAPSKIKRRPPKPTTAGSSLSPLGLAASSAPGMIPINDDDADLVTIIGKGMFDGDSGKGKSERSNSISLRSERSNSLSKSSTGYSTLRDQNSQEADLESDEVPNIICLIYLMYRKDDMEGLQMSRGLREVAAKKKRERQEESEARRRAQRERDDALRAAEEDQRRLEQEEAAERRLKQQQEAADKRRRQQEAAEKRRKEVELSRKEVLSNEESGLQIAGSSPMKTHSSLSHMQASNLSSLANSPTPSSVSTTEEPRPFSKPAVALKDAMRLIENDDWSVKMDAINKLRRLAMFHADVILPSAHSITLALIAEVKNLRSQVAKLAVIGLGDLFINLKKALDPDLDGCAKTLLPKNGEANDFIRAELDRTLDAMVNNTTSQRCLIAFIVGGASHKNPIVRKLAIKHITTLCERLGPGKLLSGIKDLTEKVVPVVASMCSDSSPETRWYARKILLMLLKHEDFELVFKKNLSDKDYRDVKQIAETLKEKGLGEMPSNTPSASGTRRSGTFNRGSRNNSAESSNSISNSMKRRPVGPQAAEDAAPLLEAMSSANWNARHESIDELMGMLVSKPKLIGAFSVKIFDKYALLLKDSNSKVAMHALDALVDNNFANLQLIKLHVTQSSINLMVQNTAAGLASKNKALQTKASELLDAFINTIDHTMLYQIFIQVAVNATPKTKPDIIDRIGYLSKKVYKITPKSVVLHALPLAWNLVKSLATTGATSVLRDAVTDFIVDLHKLFGDTLFDYAASSPGSRPEFVQKVRELSAVDRGGKGS
ncbi:TOG array regulator of axonemal microtubules protein 1-like [Watersipora subatra]|uniref:TOG array regulator of axonemal microtubules protein 1-like n=1 Tax=Watersipora subatra TaxID=2589382 RepID=UPI00355BF4A2